MLFRIHLEEGEERFIFWTKICQMGTYTDVHKLCPLVNRILVHQPEHQLWYRMQKIYSDLQEVEKNLR